ncbi:Orn/Lys/Arg family decarboxylase [Pseudodonghicola xiamenensis]|uniref:Arginine decarboxylase n=1 Tax=Pseudodonghicola xiamenensis TaxID=337702 RepID=A0A8J3MG39_9RHOB|nr:Orn/Lys/Arg decarboxylase N-terminal domain-containing protein [Pseudodonghicola xiamenensis]GHG98605.1 arginine decarboxylase [Pseudodonghicola xiamenensis]
MGLTVERRLGLKVLFAHGELGEQSAAGNAAQKLIDDLTERNVTVAEASSADDAAARIQTDAGLQCVLLDWGLADADGELKAENLLSMLRARNATIPIFLVTSRRTATELPMTVLEQVNDFIWLLEDTAEFIGGRVVAAVNRYRETVLPPMFKALAEFASVYEYSWHTPGHTGGTAFLKHIAGRAFFEFFGEELFRSDLSISVGELGSLLDHSGPIGEGEKYAARVFGADRSYTVTNGSSTSNRVIMMASVTRGQIALCDRNCHKSVEHAITLSGAIPTYLVPSRNGLGLIGPIHPQKLTAEAIRNTIADNPLSAKANDLTPVHAIITNSTYDGLCYNVLRVEELIGQSVDRLHFDEAWYGYARFNPIYEGRFAMHGAPEAGDRSGPTVFATQSTHKLLAALSQASFIHVRDGRKPIPHNRFNEAFMMHASTSPQYAIIASNDVSAAMMDGVGGLTLTSESIGEAIAFRQMIARLRAEFLDAGDWFFGAFQPETVKVGGSRVAFQNADPERLAKDASAWVLHPDDDWHGFDGLEDDYCMLDPIKVSIMTPGMSAQGKMEEQGIPAAIVSAYLDTQGIVVEKTTDFTILFLFSFGITNGKWGTLLNALLNFKKDYDADRPLREVLPDLVATHPERYGAMGLKALAEEMFAAMAELKTTEAMAQGFSTLPVPELSPVEAYEQLVLDHVESLPLDAMAGRIVATGVVPYPPGIPLLMPGENAGPADGPLLAYLKALEAFDQRFPGFAHDTHGVEVEDGKYRVLCVAAAAE